jgi:hypothetical protein
MEIYGKWITSSHANAEGLQGFTIWNYSIVTATTRRRREKLTVLKGARDKRQVVEEPCELETVRRGTRG